MVARILEAMAEAAALARAYRMEPADVSNTVVGSIFDVPVYRIYAGLISSGKFEPPGFDLLLGLKDAKLALAAGEEVNVPLPFASVLRDNYLDAIAHGDEKKDWSAMSRVAARRATRGLARYAPAECTMGCSTERQGGKMMTSKPTLACCAGALGFALGWLIAPANAQQPVVIGGTLGLTGAYAGSGRGLQGGLRSLARSGQTRRVACSGGR